MEMLKYLEDYTKKHGVRVFRCHGIYTGGACTCNKDCGKSAGKHPHTEHGFKDATTDWATIQDWYKGVKPFNVGINPDNYWFAMDVDPRNGGDKTLASWEAEHGKLPKTPKVRSGSKEPGWHFYFKVRDVVLPGNVASLDSASLPGIEIKHTKGYVIAPPSNHKDGNQYTWEVGLDECPMAQCPEWLWNIVLEAANKSKTKPKTESRDQPSRGGKLLIPINDEPDLITHPGCEENHRNTTLCELVGHHLRIGDSAETIRRLALQWNERCTPPEEEHNVSNSVDSIISKERAKAEPQAKTLTVEVQDKPKPQENEARFPALNEEGYYGLLGDIVSAMEPEMECDPAGLLLTLLTMTGSAIGKNPYFPITGTKHRCSLFTVLYGASSAGKGESEDIARWLLSKACPDWANNNDVQKTGLSSGPGLVEACGLTEEQREALEQAKRENQIYIPTTRNVFIFEPEYKSVIDNMRRKENNLNSILRLAYDGKPLSLLNRKDNSVSAYDYMLCILAHITPLELQRAFEASNDTSNGFVDRFLWAYVTSGNDLPEGGNVEVLSPYVKPLGEAIGFAQGVGEMERDDEAREHWNAVYKRLRHLDEIGVSKARGNSLRLAMIYALLDKSRIIRLEHQKAALAVWAYCEQSVRQIFNQQVLEKKVPRLPLYDRLLNVITSNPGVQRQDLDRISPRPEVAPTLEQIWRDGKAHPRRERIDGKLGRTPERWYPGQCPEGCQDCTGMDVEIIGMDGCNDNIPDEIKATFDKMKILPSKTQPWMERMRVSKASNPSQLLPSIQARNVHSQAEALRT